MVNRLDEREARARLALGMLLYDINKDECAAEVLRAGLSYDSGLVEAYVGLGFVYGRMVDYEEMVGAFREAISRSHQAARAAISEEPEEVKQARLILYAPQHLSATSAMSCEPAVPSYVREAWELSELACEHIGTGRDAEAVEALERSLKLDPISPHATSLLVFAYLVMNDDQRTEWADRSVLWKISPWLGRLLFVH